MNLCRKQALSRLTYTRADNITAVNANILTTDLSGLSEVALDCCKVPVEKPVWTAVVQNQFASHIFRSKVGVLSERIRVLWAWNCITGGHQVIDIRISRNGYNWGYMVSPSGDIRNPSECFSHNCILLIKRYSFPLFLVNSFKIFSFKKTWT